MTIYGAGAHFSYFAGMTYIGVASYLAGVASRKFLAGYFGAFGCGNSVCRAGWFCRSSISISGNPEGADGRVSVAGGAGWTRTVDGLGRMPKPLDGVAMYLDLLERVVTNPDLRGRPDSDAADSFRGIPDTGAAGHSLDRGMALRRYNDVLGVPLAQVKANFEQYGQLDDRVEFLDGYRSRHRVTERIEIIDHCGVHWRKCRP